MTLIDFTPSTKNYYWQLMIRFISADEVLPIRNMVLREGRLTADEGRFANDEARNSFHLGYFSDEKLLSIASFHQQGLPALTGKGYQLRGMATLKQYQGKGLGKLLLNFGMISLKGQKINYLWCNARKAALAFYVRSGFEVISQEFDIQGIGPHYKMCVKLA